MSKFGWHYPAGAGGDPFAPYNQDENYGDYFEEIIKALEAFDTGKWDWEKIDCCLTGKDADLEPWGQQGIEVKACDQEGVTCMAHSYKTIAGNEVCLNLSPREEKDDRIFEWATKRYLEEAEQVVAGCDVPGEWDGDDWAMGGSLDFRVPWTFKPGDAGEPDYAATAKAIVKEALRVLEPWEKELVLADEILNVLAGWTERNPETGEIVTCPSGQPGQCAAWRQ